MRLLDVSYSVPAYNLALDETLLEGVAAGTIPDTLRFWESPVSFVVIGSGQQLRRVVHEFQCLQDGIPILRRCSAGGAVLQGPGSLNFALALSYERFPDVALLHGSYDFILERVVLALASLGLKAQRGGVSDLAIEGMKCSGNAQRRKRNACLHHGTLLYRVDHDAMGRYLVEPEDRPAYRGMRTHEEFVGGIGVSPDKLRMALLRIFCPNAVSENLSPDESEAVCRLAQEKYGSPAWNYRR